MKLILTASTLFIIFLTGVVSTSLVSKANTLIIDSLQRSVFVEIIPENTQNL